ncbi:ABC transporter permease [Gracilibacillus salitolerans]|uniref:ABC transporter permease n=1 Tax=Gracilibacillus salitolerans TaxID=2663022 RepID=A0A5Q2THW6_9BACI|nr:ABC transporter permease [Gracilibacillus salitolerans]QGH33737.1 ABC transporter permease [Gracilibacillus salitolerans]
MTIFQFALKRSLRNITNILLLTLFPIACIFLPEGEVWPFIPYGYQYFGILILFIGIRLASIILEDREKGVVKRLAVTPVSHFQYLSQNLLAYAIILILQSSIVVYGGVLFGQELYQPVWLLLLYVSFSFASLAIALAWISIYRRKEISFLIYMSFIFLVVVLGGIMIPIEIFPNLLKRIAVIFPTYWLAEGLDWVVFGENILDFLLINGVLWLYTIIFLIIGSTRKIY